MSIKEVLNQGELLNEEQQENVAGGMEANINDAWFCDCKGTGDNTNRDFGCSCSDDTEEEEEENP